MASPTAFGFLGSTPVPIALDGASLTNQGHPLSLIGGDVRVSGGSLAGSRVSVASLRGPGEVALAAPDGTPMLEATPAAERGTVHLTAAQLRGQSVVIRAGRLLLDTASIEEDGSVVSSAATRPADRHAVDLQASNDVVLGGMVSGDINVEARSISVNPGFVLGSPFESCPSGCVNLALTSATSITGGHVLVLNRADVAMTAREDIALSGFGNAGFGHLASVALSAGRDISIRNGLRSSSQSLDVTQAGSIALDAGRDLRVGSVDAQLRIVAGSGGDVMLSAGRDLRARSVVTQSARGGGGDVVLTAGRDLTVCCVSTRGGRVRSRAIGRRHDHRGPRCFAAGDGRNAVGFRGGGQHHDRRQDRPQPRHRPERARGPVSRGGPRRSCRWRQHHHSG